MCILDKKEKLAQKCATNLLHTWGRPGVFLFYDIFCLDVERPPAPSPVCNKLVAQCTVFRWLMLPELSTVLYYTMQCEAVKSLKTGNFVYHFDALLVIRSKKILFLSVNSPFVSWECKKIRVSSFKKCFFGLQKLVIFKKSAEKPFSKAKISSFWVVRPYFFVESCK